MRPEQQELEQSGNRPQLGRTDTEERKGSASTVNDRTRPSAVNLTLGDTEPRAGVCPQGGSTCALGSVSPSRGRGIIWRARGAALQGERGLRISPSSPTPGSIAGLISAEPAAQDRGKTTTKNWPQGPQKSYSCSCLFVLCFLFLWYRASKKSCFSAVQRKRQAGGLAGTFKNSSPYAAAEAHAHPDGREHPSCLSSPLLPVLFLGRHPPGPGWVPGRDSLCPLLLTPASLHKFSPSLVHKEHCSPPCRPAHERKRKKNRRHQQSNRTPATVSPGGVSLCHGMQSQSGKEINLGTGQCGLG
ncbi:uncharacterized protein LOC109118360 isoform X2 [Fukomys damarensis]|uniref:uncharacterized protein LOC109118360 isoform X2 n=1 Tax=Fukomys damarensis TaxID=885580 RepID=UPI0008FEB807|nr:uncharacterized protein LOC109118360 isoform X2 [Fukomys damarensis]